MNAPVLVVGATGRHGGTGTTVVNRLCSHGRPVRALVHSEDDRAVELRRLGATTVVGDLHDRASLVAAVRDVSAVYFTYPVAAGIVSAAANLTSVLAEVTPKPHLVVMSMAVSSVDSPSRPGQVAAEVVDVAKKPQLPLRIPIGDAARALLAARKAARDDIPFAMANSAS
jgi:uncharacterized protein YbjT (DUF2867 family)